jgi:hypothetical protein
VNSEVEFFDGLQRRLEALVAHPERDNEATRHDSLIYPLLTSPFGLGWDPTDLVSQASIPVPAEITQSHFFRNAIPKSRKPDILISPSDIRPHVAVVEEKAQQADLDRLNGYRVQVAEYQVLYECAWGILSDGDKWILRRNLEAYLQFNSLAELRLGIQDLRQCVGKENILSRWRNHGTCDLIIIAQCGDVAAATREPWDTGSIEQLRSVLKRSPRSFDYLREQKRFSYTDEQFMAIIANYKDDFAFKRIKHRDQGKRIIPGRAGMCLKRRQDAP